jgi:hypothetical protein
MKTNPFTKTAALVLLIVASTFSEVSQARPLWIWHIVIQGQTSNQPFQRDGWLYVLNPGLNNDPKSTSGENPVEVVVSSGDPSGMSSLSFPPNGSFEFSTNGIWYSILGSPNIDLAFVTLDQSCVVMRPDMNRLTPAEMQIINTFSTRGETHVISDGTIQICSNDGLKTVNGSIDVVGYRAIGGPTTGSTNYTATIQGQLYSVSDTGW